MRFIGDVHGKWDPYKRIIKTCPESIQVGDMGVGFRRWDMHEHEWRYSSNPPHEEARLAGDHRYIRGNHDNPEVCRKQGLWIPDGTMHKGVFCLGGASSIDREYRTEGADWWPDEEMSLQELDKAIDDYLRIRPEVVVTHDCPERLAPYVRGKLEGRNRTREALQIMWEGHQPALWVHGHWHLDLRRKAGATEFVCLAELSYMDADLERGSLGPIVPRN